MCLYTISKNGLAERKIDVILKQGLLLNHIPLVFQSNPPYSTLFLPNNSLLIPKYLETCFVCDVHPTIIKLI